MKIEKISDNTIKVTISVNDLEERNIDLDALNYNSPAAQKLFWDMMEQAEIEFGFNVSDSQLVIEPTPDTEEGFIVTITKMDEDGDFESIQKYIKSKFKKTDVRLKRKSHKLLSTLMIYSFDNFDDLCVLCKNIHSMYSGDSSIYKYKNTYYLLLERNNTTACYKKILELHLGEYGNKVSNVGFYEGYLNEYGTVIIENNAIETIESYF